jgi:hypothetical protein
MNHDEDKKWKLTVVAILQTFGRSSGSYAPPQLTELCLVADNFRCHWQILKMHRGISNKLRSLLLVFSREAQLTIRRPHREQDEAHSLPSSARLRPTCSVTPRQTCVVFHGYVV